jgi:hypothetical protein
VWDEHATADLGDGACLLQIDRLLLHDVTGGVIMREMGWPATTPIHRRRCSASSTIC